MIAAMERILQRHAALARRLHEQSAAELRAEFAPSRGQTAAHTGAETAEAQLSASRTETAQAARVAKAPTARMDTEFDGRPSRGTESDAARLSASFEREARRYE